MKTEVEIERKIDVLQALIDEDFKDTGIFVSQTAIIKAKKEIKILKWVLK